MTLLDRGFPGIVEGSFSPGPGVKGGSAFGRYVFDLRLLTQQPAESRITLPRPVKYINGPIKCVNVWCQCVISLEYMNKSKGNISGHCAPHRSDKPALHS